MLPLENDAPAAPPSVRSAKPRFDRSDVIAFVALFISIIGTLISFLETDILQEQQSLMQEEKAAAVWPYVNGNLDINFKDSLLTLTFTLKNKGVGPAIIGGIELGYAGDTVSTRELAPAIGRKYPGITIIPLRAVDVKHSVLATGEEVTLYRLGFPTGQKIEVEIGEITADLSTFFCYCSVYGDCWNYSETGWPVATQDCQRGRVDKL